ncbi:MAG TPA: hypothetical protein VN065_19770 [Bradyrhizobium sp.]|jgi:hypothetical protein|nr:hypothetical protein [Bradyrhizobium sp.]
MTCLKLAPAAILAVLALASGPALARHHHHHAYRAYPYWLPYEISYLHNYGPGPLPGTFAYYDGPSTNLCNQGSANYLGQDHRKYPCF